MLAATLLAASATGALAGCSRAVPLQPPQPAAPAAAECAALVAALPDQLAGQTSRPTEPESAYTAAWGEPVISLRCGVDRPESLTATSDVISVGPPDGPTVDWFPVPLTNGYRFTTVGRSAFVEVDVPTAYAPEVDPLVALAGPIHSALPLRGAPAATSSPLSASPSAVPAPS